MNEVREAARIRLPTSAGEFDTRAFECRSGYVYLALVRGDIGDGQSVLTRVHSECLTFVARGVRSPRGSAPASATGWGAAITQSG